MTIRHDLIANLQLERSLWHFASVGLEADSPSISVSPVHTSFNETRVDTGFHISRSLTVGTLEVGYS